MRSSPIGISRPSEFLSIMLSSTQDVFGVKQEERIFSGIRSQPPTCGGCSYNWFDKHTKLNIIKVTWNGAILKRNSFKMQVAKTGNLERSSKWGRFWWPIGWAVSQPWGFTRVDSFRNIPVGCKILSYEFENAGRGSGVVMAKCCCPQG